MHRGRRRQAERIAQPLAAGDAFGDHLRRVAVQNPEVLLQHITERPVRDPVTIRQAPATAQQRPPCILGQPPPELTDKPCLAHPGITDDSHQERPAADGHLAVSLLQVRQLAAAADEHRLQAAQPARARQRHRAHQPAAHHPFGLALRLHRHRADELECAPHGRHRPLTHQDLPWSSHLLQAGAHIDRIPGDERAALPRSTHHDIAGVHTDAERQPPAEQLFHPPLHPQGRMQRPLRVVLMRHGRPEGRHHRISDELLDRPTGPLHLRPHRIVETVKQQPNPLRILTVRKLGRPDEIREKNCRELALLTRHNPDCAPATGWPARAHHPQVSASCQQPRQPGD